MLVREGWTVRTFTRRNCSELDELGVESSKGDIRESQKVLDACQNIDVVFHVAAIAGIGNDWQTFYDVNTIGTENVISACKKYSVPKLIFTSSPSVTFDGTDQINVNESAPYPNNWLSHYPHTKAMAEQKVLAANDPPKLMTCSLRPHLIWGPRDQHLIPRLLDRARSGKLRIVGDGTNLVDNIYVENAALAHLQAAIAMNESSKVCGSAYFLSQGEPVNCWDWINEILQLAEIPKLEKKISFKAAWTIGNILEKAYWLMRNKDEPRMTRFLAAQLATSHYFDISKARNDFGYEPVVSLEEGMQRLADELK